MDEVVALISRRKFIEGSGALAGVAAFQGSAFSLAAPAGPIVAPDVLDPSSLTPFVDSLPIPQIARSVGFQANPEDPAVRLPVYRMAMQQVQAKLHRDLPATSMWGFNGSSPGPIFETRKEHGLLVEWANELPSRHFLPIDHTLHGAERNVPEVRSVVHLHGGKSPPESDGYPENWFVPGKSSTCHYPNRQDATLLFYHDHTMGINRLNIYAGLQGLFLIRDDAEDALDLPRGKYEVPLLIYDRLLRPDGQLYYPVSADPKSPWVPEVFGNAILVNGKLSPYLEVEPRKYRLRVMNGSNGRFYRFSFSNGMEFHQIGADQGLLAAPVEARRLSMAPGERADIVVDFSASAGQKVLLKSDAFDIMQFQVGAQGAKSASPLPQKLRDVPRIPETSAVKTRRLTLDEKLDMAQGSMGMLLNNTAWHMPVTENPTLDSTEIWEFVNLTDDSHPIHLHLVRFQILDRRRFDAFEFQDKGVLRFTGPAHPPDPGETAWKDTVRADPGMVTRIIVPFEGYAGRYVWHCHILEHEDNDMMRPYEVVARRKV